MLPHFNWSEDEWVELGPGSRSCLVKMFGPDVLPHAQHAIRYLRDHQFSWYNLIGAAPAQIPRVSPHKTAGLTMVDIEHSLCECEKYARGRFPELKGRRTRVGKHVYVPHDDVPTADIPLHWLEERATEAPRCPSPVDGTDDVYAVERVVAETERAYCLRWEGYGVVDDTWEPKEAVRDGSQQLVDQWETTKSTVLASVEKRRKKKARSPSPEVSRTRRRTTF